jgi:hypothetical protein
MVRHLISGEAYHIQLVLVELADNRIVLVANRVITIEPEDAKHWERVGKLEAL